MPFGVITGELKECIAEVMLFQVAVSSQRSIGVREMAHSIREAVHVVPVRAGMGVYGGAVVGNREVFLWVQAAFNGRQDGGVVKRSWSRCSKLKECFTIHQSCGRFWGGSLVSSAFYPLASPASCCSTKM